MAATLLYLRTHYVSCAAITVSGKKGIVKLRSQIDLADLDASSVASAGTSAACSACGYGEGDDDVEVDAFSVHVASLHEKR